MDRILIKVGSSKRIAFVRVLPHSDLMSSIKTAFLESGFQVAQVSGGIGSLEAIAYTYVTSNGKYHAPIIKKGYFELINTSGFIALNKNNVDIHIHSIMADQSGTIFGGHLLEEGNKIFATCELTLIEIKGITIKREFDNETGFTLFK